MNTEIILTIIGSSALFSFIQYLITRFDNKRNNAFVSKNDISPIKNALMAMLQFRLEAIMTSAIKDGEIKPTTLKNINTLLSAYEDLGGDDYIHCLYEQIKELKIS